MAADVLKTTKNATRSALTTGRTVIGLDIGAHVAKAAICRRQHSGWDVLAVDTLRLNPGDTADPETLGGRMVAWLKQMSGDLATHYAASLPSHFVDYETLELPQPADYQQTARLAMQELLGEDLEDVAYDFWTVEEGASDKLHLAWAMGSFATSVTNQFAKRGLQCRGLDAPVAALARVKAGSPTADSRLIVDLGSGEATFVFSRSNQAHYFRNRIRVADRSTAEMIAQRQSISIEAAATLLSSHGIADPQANPLAALMHRALEDWLHDLAFEIQRTSQFILARWGSNAIEEIVICGGGACIRGIDRHLANQLDLPIRSAAISTGWRWLAGQSYSPLFAQALALVEYGAGA
jgi:Tfp pilus assembly PilM family ATPase